MSCLFFSIFVHTSESTYLSHLSISPEFLLSPLSSSISSHFFFLSFLPLAAGEASRSGGADPDPWWAGLWRAVRGAMASPNEELCAAKQVAASRA